MFARYTSGMPCRRWVEFHHQRQAARAIVRIDCGAAKAASPKASRDPSNNIVLKLTRYAARVKPWLLIKTRRCEIPACLRRRSDAARLLPKLLGTGGLKSR